MQSLSRGILIACEGIDGSGKSTLVKNLACALMESDFSVVATREPGATPLGSIIRTIIQEKKVSMCPKAEYSLFVSDRAQHFHEIVIPSLQARKIVISDRMADSSIVYQGFGHGLSLEAINFMNTWSMEGIKPDITFYLKISVAQARKRITQRNEQLTSYEKEKNAFFSKLIDGFDMIFADRSDVVFLDGSESPEHITEKAVHAVRAFINKQGLV